VIFRIPMMTGLLRSSIFPAKEKAVCIAVDYLIISLQNYDRKSRSNRFLENILTLQRIL
jgi:hypothetical protein